MTAKLSESWSEGMDLGAVLQAAVAALAGAERTLSADDLEIAVLSRSNGRRCFKRLTDDEVAELLVTS